MSRLRATIVACLTLAIAALPAAGVSAYTSSSEAPSISEHASCCPDGEACATQATETQAKDHQAKDHQAKDHQAKNHHGKGRCPDHPACGGKCLCLGLGLTAVLPAASGALVAPMPVDEAARIAESAASPAYIPPSPPPRV